MKIKFVINEYREKGSTKSNFNPKLSNYWKMLYYKQLRKWYE